MSAFSLQKIDDNEAPDLPRMFPNVPFTQSEYYARWQAAYGRAVERFFIYKDNTPVLYALFVQYPLRAGKYYYYAPYGPLLADLPEATSKELLIFLSEKLYMFAQTHNAVFVRLDFTPPIKEAIVPSPLLKQSPKTTYSGSNFQPRTEWCLNLQKSEEELFENMHKKTRYSIKTSSKRGAQSEIITEGLDRYFDEFYRLMQETARRHGFRLYEKMYYKTVLHNLPKNSFLVRVRYRGKILVINLVIVYGDTATHVFGGSSSMHRGALASYTAQWAALQHARRIGCSEYNFGGIASGDKRNDLRELSRFKKRFGGYELSRGALYDLVVNPLWYTAYTTRKSMQSILKPSKIAQG